MSLIAWWPLDGSTVNQGLSTAALTNSGATINDNGKIGKCYYFNNSYMKSDNFTYLSDGIYSVAYWVKYESFPQWNQYCVALNTSTSSDELFFVGVVGATGAADPATAKLSVNASASDKILNLNTWYHVACAYDGTHQYLYLNGTLVKTYSLNVNKTGTNFTIGGRAGSLGMNCKCYLNDVRIYNHCLSAREVGELALGLILHYPMMMPDGIIGGENLIKDIISKPTVDKLTKYSAQTKGLAKDTYFQVTFTEQLQLNTNYTVSYDIEKISGTYDNNKWNFGIGSQNNATKVSFLPGHYEYTFQLTKSSEQNNFLFDDADRPTTPPIIKIKNLKIERGSVATPFTPAPSEVPLWNNHIVYDASGYRHNATYTDTSKPSWDSDSPVGLGSYVFDGSKTYLAAGRGAMVTDAITVSAWIYCSNWANYKTAISCTESGGWNFEPYNGKLNFALNRGGSYSGGAIGPTLSFISSGWHLITGTYDGYQTKCYLDGKLAEQETASTIKKAITYNSGNGVFIGGEAAGNQTAPVSYCAANTKICDVRVYATALSAEDIERLYKVRYAVANNGSVFSYSYIENDSGNVTYGKNGVMMAQDFGAGMGRENLASGTASITATSGTSTQAYSIDIDFWNAHQGETITLSFDYDATNWVGSRFGFEPDPYGASHHYLGCWVKNSANGKGRFSVTTVIPKGDKFTTNVQSKMYVQGTTSGSVKISRPKIELGAGPTPWCPSYRDTVGGDLEDIDTAQIYENAVIARELYEWI